jgi:LacI family transcriptional regulator
MIILAPIQSGAIAACREFGYHLVPEPLLLADGATAEKAAEGLRDLLNRLPVDGVILTPPLSDSSDAIDIVKQMKVPVVLVAPSDVEINAHTVQMCNRLYQRSR